MAANVAADVVNDLATDLTHARATVVLATCVHNSAIVASQHVQMCVDAMLDASEKHAAELARMTSKYKKARRVAIITKASSLRSKYKVHTKRSGIRRCV